MAVHELMASVRVTRQQATLSVLAGSAAALMPKCPLCLMALASALGLRLPLGPALLPLRIALTFVATIVIARISLQRHRRGPLLLAVVVAIAIVAGALTGRESAALSSVAMLAMIGAALWAAWRSPSRGDPHCTESTSQSPTKTA